MSFKNSKIGKRAEMQLQRNNHPTIVIYNPQNGGLGKMAHHLPPKQGIVHFIILNF
jgi:hypothetical protein